MTTRACWQREWSRVGRLLRMLLQESAQEWKGS